MLTKCIAIWIAKVISRGEGTSKNIGGLFNIDIQKVMVICCTESYLYSMYVFIIFKREVIILGKVSAYPSKPYSHDLCYAHFISGHILAVSNNISTKSTWCQNITVKLSSELKNSETLLYKTLISYYFLSTHPNRIRTVYKIQIQLRNF